ncbi:hypothetical protein WMY93_000620 [Mugilogobius chulae]|uniref:C-type lectin domain-containing protein n=1 Tax=Mugilogobius chulae TaxID=88201 RepID=A0AAW0QAG7_9GOBI
MRQQYFQKKDDCAFALVTQSQYAIYSKLLNNGNAVVSSKAHERMKLPKMRAGQMELMLVLLLLAGDIEINPGPLSPAPSNPPASVSNPIQHSGFQAYPPFWFPFPPVVSACPRCGLDVASPGGQMFPGLAPVPVSAPGLPLMPGGSVAGAGELQGVPISVPRLCACTPFGVSNASSGDGVQPMPFESVEVAFGHGPFADPADLLRRGRTGAGCFAEVQMDPQKLFTAQVSSQLYPMREYYYVNITKTWHDARAYCKENCHDLAVYDSLEDVQLVSKPSMYSWIGLSDDITNWRPTMGNASNSWIWSATGKHSRTGYHNFFYPSQPNRYSPDEVCITMMTNGQWQDYSCYSLRLLHR